MLVMAFKGTVREFRQYLLSWRTNARLEGVLNYDLARAKKVRERVSLPRLKRSFPLYWE